MFSDFRYAIRVLRRSPRNTIVAVSILALAIGANTVMFSAINHVLIRPFPFRDPDRLVRVRDQRTAADGQVAAYNMPAAHVIALRSNAGVFDGVVAFSDTSMTLTGGNIPERVAVVLESDTGEGTLGVRPILGRPFGDDERRRGLDSGAAIISHALWLSRFGGSPAAIGRTLRLDGRPFTVVGVMPPAYSFPYDAQCWLPFTLDATDKIHDFAVFGRMRDGATMPQVRLSLADVAAGIQRAGDAPRGYGLELMSVRDNLAGSQAGPIRALTLVVAFLLLIACVNVATLLLARSVARRREFAIRTALGASRLRHVRQSLAESVVLAALGCGGGLLVAVWFAPLTSSLVPAPLHDQLGLTTPSIDWRVLAFAVAASAVCAIVAGVAPAAGGWNISGRAALSDGGRSGTAGSHRHVVLGVLIVAETTLTLMLVAGAGLVIRNFVRLQTTPAGFQPEGLLAVEVSLPESAYAVPERRDNAVRRIVAEVRAVPGVAAAGVTTVNPLGGGTWGTSVVGEEQAAADPDARLNVNERLVSVGLLDAMRVPILQGRAFTDTDRAGAPAVAVVSRRLAMRLWPTGNALGRRLRLARPGAEWVTVVGVAGDVNDSHYQGVPLETWYRPFAQQAAAAAALHFFVMARDGADPLSLVPAVERAIVAADKTLAPYAPVAMDRYFADTISRERISAGLMSAFGIFALALAALGIYGVMAFGVSQRTAEIGVRMALGASVGDILPLVMRRGMGLVAAGAAAGLAGAVGLNRLLASVLVGVSTLDPGVVGVAAALIVSAAAAACLVPALNAARMDPAAALKRES